MYIPQLGELVVYTTAFVGACIGFLWYNAFPAQVFMGDTGSLAIGSIIAVLAFAVRKEILIPLLCGVFVIENLSVVLQVSYFKYTKQTLRDGAPHPTNGSAAPPLPEEKHARSQDRHALLVGRHYAGYSHIGNPKSSLRMIRTWSNRYLKGDPVVWFVVLALSAFGVLVVYSAASSLAYRVRGGNTEYYLVKHISLLLVSLLAMWFTHRVDYRYFARISTFALVLSVPLLLYTWRFGETINQASRWVGATGARPSLSAVGSGQARPDYAPGRDALAAAADN